MSCQYGADAIAAALVADVTPCHVRRTRVARSDYSSDRAYQRQLTRNSSQARPCLDDRTFGDGLPPKIEKLLSALSGHAVSGDRSGSVSAGAELRVWRQRNDNP
jgi:hypothetical protein